MCCEDEARDYPAAVREMVAGGAHHSRVGRHRLVGTEHDDVLGVVPYAHTSAVYVENPDRHWIDADAVRWCREWLDRLAARTHSHGNFYSLGQEQALLGLVLQAREVLDRRAS
jgi:hypothetical protein